MTKVLFFGTRFPKHSKNIPKVKRIVLKLIARITDLVTGIALSDAHNGLKAYKVNYYQTTRITVFILLLRIRANNASSKEEDRL